MLGPRALDISLLLACQRAEKRRGMLGGDRMLDGLLIHPSCEKLADVATAGLDPFRE
jgi:hypothetical protein